MPVIYGSFGSSHAGIHTCLSSMEALVPPTLAFTHACHLWKLWFHPRWHSHMPVIDPLIYGSFGSSHAGIHTCLSLIHSSMEALVPPTLAFTHACHLWKLWFLPRWHSHMPVQEPEPFSQHTIRIRAAGSVLFFSLVTHC
ncbi:hypothetical protein RRG08_002670 [Elysia crispata]|uniref:Uncharacterized protein n=1 Tax=Elysia crispata TaxID=231223 RepID=A0AAE0XTV3_9GAST|nr:hypothetical protein RRG08_002670 [Elysia crispata]